MDADAARTALLERRQALLDVAASGDDAARPVELDQQRFGRVSRMDALQAQAMSEDGKRRRQVELNRIDAALARIERDDYGLCLRCDEPIAEGRLAADPAAPLCIDCASAADTR